MGIWSVRWRGWSRGNPRATARLLFVSYVLHTILSPISLTRLNHLQHLIQLCIQISMKHPERPSFLASGQGATNIVLSLNIPSSCLIKYFAITIPAGHNMPPQPFLRSSSNLRGFASKPSKSTSMTPACLFSRSGTSSSSMSKTPFRSSSDSVIVFFEGGKGE
jgi:hypothetical protein